jgi:CSLREA domain-containing protein
MKGFKLFRLFSYIIVAFIILFSGIVSSHAATINVTASATDTLNGANSQCSLREAITNINNGATTYADCGPTGVYGTNDTINIPAGTYPITIVGGDEDSNASGDFDIKKSVTIVGAGAVTTIINGGAIDRVFDIDPTGAGGVVVSISGVTITGGDNTASDDRGGGGIYNNGTLTVTSSTISGNTETGDNDGGGIYNNFALTVTNSTISGNVETDAAGGGIYNDGALTVTNSTISGNTASSGGNGGGGILNDGALTVTNSTISGNSAGSGGGISHLGSAVATLYNTIVASNTGGNCAGTISSNGGNNIDDGTTCGWGSANGSMSSTNPQLGALALNSPGTTLTHALLAGSPAIDGVTYNAPNNAPLTDQRGVARPQGVRYDIGSYEYTQQPPPPTQVQVPTLTEWGMIILMVLAGIGSVYYMRRQKRANN